MPILAGVDEAGLGPRLGPLVAVGVTFTGPAEVLAMPLWEALAPAVSRRRGSLLIADSKSLYRGQRDRKGWHRLEHGVLVALGTGCEPPASLGELLDRVGAADAVDEERFPFYCFGAMPLPVTADLGPIRRDGQRLARQLRELGLEPPRVTCEVVFERTFNRLVAEAGGKGGVLLEVDGRLLRRLPLVDGQLYLDRLGGRRRYGCWLEKVFAQGFVWTVGENATTSRYRVLREGGVCLEVVVTVGCEKKQLPVALASMVAKYIRELYMLQLNRYWAARVPGLAPTAGYPADAARFLQQIAAAAKAEGLSEDDCTRCR